VKVSVWRIGTDTPNHTAEDLKGKGAEITGGRWNRGGTAVIYASKSIALACLETVVHLNAASGLPLNRYLVEITVPDAQWAARTVLRERALPIGWDAIPPGAVSLDLGDGWLTKKATLLLEIASVVVPEETNVLINPAHLLASQVHAAKLRRWTYDPRVRR
jgi:RES domain-containing protein